MPNFYSHSEISHGLARSENGRTSLGGTSFYLNAAEHEALTRFFEETTNYQRIVDLCRFAIEYPMPHSGQAADLVCVGKDSHGRINVTVIELKNYASLEKSGVDLSLHWFRIGDRVFLHPAIQALQYKRILQFNLKSVEAFSFHAFAMIFNWAETMCRSLLSHPVIESNEAGLFFEADPSHPNSIAFALQNLAGRSCNSVTDEELSPLIKPKIGVSAKLFDLIEEKGSFLFDSFMQVHDPLYSATAIDTLRLCGIDPTGEQENILGRIKQSVAEVCSEASKQRSAFPERRCLLIKGEPGTGKTLLAVTAAMEAMSRKPNGNGAVIGVRNAALRETLRAVLATAGVPVPVSCYKATQKPAAGLSYPHSISILLPWQSSSAVALTLIKSSAVAFSKATTESRVAHGFVARCVLEFDQALSDQEQAMIAGQFEVTRKELKAIHGQEGRTFQQLTVNASRGNLSALIARMKEYENKLAEYFDRAGTETPRKSAAVRLCIQFEVKGLISESEWEKLQNDVVAVGDPSALGLIRYLKDNYLGISSAPPSFVELPVCPDWSESWLCNISDLIVADEAQRAEPGTKSEPCSYVRAVLQKGRVVCFLYDPYQVLYPLELDTVEAIKTECGSLGIHIEELELRTPIRVHGGEPYYEWLKHLLYGRPAEHFPPLVEVLRDERLSQPDFVFDVASSPSEFLAKMDKLPIEGSPHLSRAIFASWTSCRGKLRGSENSVSLSSTFNLPSLRGALGKAVTEKNGRIFLSLSLPHVQNEANKLALMNCCENESDRMEIARAWEFARKHWLRLDAGDRKVWWFEGEGFKEYWFDRHHRLDRAVTVNGAQGHEVRHAGVIWGNDLVWDKSKGNWIIGDSAEDLGGFSTYLQAAKNSPSMATNALRLLANRYFILLTRGICGVTVFCEHSGTAEHLRNRIYGTRSS